MVEQAPGKLHKLCVCWGGGEYPQAVDLVWHLQLRTRESPADLRVKTSSSVS